MNVIPIRFAGKIRVVHSMIRWPNFSHVDFFCSTPDYLAPEIIRGTGHDWAVDYWALGIFLFELTNGYAPFCASNQARRTRKILKGYEFVDVPPHFSRSLKDLIVRLLEKNPAKRLGRTQGGIQAIKKHIFFAGFDWQGDILVVMIFGFRLSFRI